MPKALGGALYYRSVEKRPSSLIPGIGLTHFGQAVYARGMKRLQSSSSLIPYSRWLAYAAAAGATALGGAQSAEAEIHYSGAVNAKFIGDNVTKKFALDNSARLVFVYGYDVQYQGSYYYGAWFGIHGAAVSNQFRGYRGLFTTFYVSRLAPGKLVSHGNFADNAPTYALNFLASSYGAGAFGTRGQGQGRAGGFIGFRFDNGNGMQYGWARVKLRSPPLGIAEGFMLVDYAWGDPGDTIITGQTSSNGDTVNAVPDSGSLGLLALGGTGLMAWRERRAGTGIGVSSD